MTQLARMGLGLAAVGRPAYITTGRSLLGDRSPEDLRRRTHELLDAAYASGIRYFDTARSYGRAEEFLGSWLTGHPEASDLTVASKWGYTYTAEWRTDVSVHEVKDHSLAAYVRQLPETVELLGRWLSIYQIHSVTPDSPALTDTALHRRLAELARGGVVIGFSTSGPRQQDAVRAALEVEVDGHQLFRSVQATWNLLEPSVGDALAYASAQGCRVIVKEGVANGRLVDGSGAVKAVAQDVGVTADAVSLAAALAQPWADIVLSGAITTAQLTSNLAAVEVHLEPQHLERLAALAEPSDQYWAERSRRAWS